MTVIISEFYYIHTHLGHQKCAISEHICTTEPPEKACNDSGIYV